MKRLFITMLLLLPGLIVSAQKPYEFQDLTNADGLSSSAISSIYQDPDGIMWFGSWDGLNAYDGRDIKIYKSAPDDSNTLTNNVILDIIGGVDPEEIWVATFRGVNRLNTGSGKVDRYFLGFDSIMPSQYFTFSIARAAKTIYCSLYDSSLFYYNNNSADFEKLEVLFENKNITKLLSDESDNLWIQCDWRELYRYTPHVNSDGSQEPGECEQILNNISVSYIFQKDGQNFWIIDDQSSLYLFDTANNRLTLIVSLKGKVAGEISSISQREDDIYIASSDKGLWIYSYRNDRTTALEGIDGQWVLSMNYCSRQDIMWLGTNGNGVIKMCPSSPLFNSIRNDELLSNYKKSQIRSIYEDVNGDIWVGSRGDGINVISGIGNEKQKIRHVEAWSNQAVMSIVRGDDNDIFVGTESDGLWVFRNKNRGRPERVNAGDIDGAYSMYWDSLRSALWVGTNGKGLFRLDMEVSPNRYRVKESRQYKNDPDNPDGISNDNCFAILPADAAHLWIGTRGGGLNLMDIESETFTKVRHNGREAELSDDEVFSLAHSSDGGLWIGTSYGLNRLMTDPQGRMTVKYYTEKDGFLNNTIHGVIEDSRGVVWMSTNKGITKLDTNDGNIVNYCDGYGLQSNEFSDLAYLKASNGMIFFGGINGINYFKPSQISERKFVPRIKITSLVINNIPTSLFDKKRVRKGNEVIYLKHNENFFNVSFVALDFINNSNCEYTYILEGFNKEWVRSGVNNSAIFTNVPPGKYTMRIRSTNGDKVWVDNEYVQEIEIGVPWWNSWWSYVIFALVLGCAGCMAYKVIRKRVKLQRSLFLERLEKNQQQQIHDARLHFFTNIAHEFITPLTLIYGPVERLLDSQELDNDGSKYLKVIKANAERMQKLIDELMDFRKMDSGHQELSLESVELEELVLYIADNFTQFAEQMSITLSSDIDPSIGEWVTDRNCMEKIMFNLISNAYKYTNENGSIDLTFMQAGDHLVIKIRNTGRGIKAGDLDSIFDNFHILDNFEQQAKRGAVRRSGIGLALTKSLVTLLEGEITVSSEENHYVEFTIRLPRLSLPEAESKPKLQTESARDVEFGHNDRKRSILVVEDEAQIRELIKDILQDRYKIIEAANGVEALEVIKKKRPDLIISDIEMPQMNGIELLEELKNNKFTNHIPVVFLSVMATMEDQITGIQKGLEYFIPKPFNPRHVEAVVNQLLNNREHLKNYYNSSWGNMEEYQGRIITVEDEEFINKITRIIESNLENEDLNSTLICNELFISRIQLYRKLKSIMDLAPSDFIRQVKLNNAAKLLRTTNLTVQEIMFRSGFNNRSYFYSIFKKEFGLSPLNLRDKTNSLS